MHYVIIGNSASGVAAIEAIRESDQKGKITVISKEPYLNYSRPLISYFLGRKVKLDQMNFCQKDFFQENKVDLFLNKKVEAVDCRKKYLILSNGQRVAFDKLLIATGGVPIIPDIKGIHSKGVFTVTKLADAQKIEKFIQTNKVKTATVIGAGLIGLKATEALIALGIKVNIVELADRILSSTFDKKASGIITDALRQIGCNLFTNNTAIEIRAENRKQSKERRKAKEVVLKDKKRIPCDLVIVAVGVKPNIKLTKNTPIKTNKGILVDKFLQTNVKNVYAAGDCSEAMDTVLGANRVLAIWPVALRQGKLAGYNMSQGKKQQYLGGLAMNAVELCALPTISVGLTNLQEKNCQSVEVFDKAKSIYKKLVLKDNKIVGAILVGNIERAGIYTGLIKDKVDVSAFQDALLEKDFGLVYLPKEYRKHLVAREAAII